MRISKGTLNGNPFVGVLGIVTDRLALVPQGASKKELKNVEDILGVEACKITLAASSLLGVLAVGLKDRFILSELVEDVDVAHLSEMGLKVKVIRGISAIGNLVAVTENGGVYSKEITEKQARTIAEFLGVELYRTTIANSELVGASVVANTNGFIVRPQVSKQEMEVLKKAFKVEGLPTTANYGDIFVGNSVLANSHGVLTGEKTSAHELMRIDEAFSGGETDG
jgi:translation initiation factor 6